MRFPRLKYFVQGPFDYNNQHSLPKFILLPYVGKSRQASQSSIQCKYSNMYTHTQLLFPDSHSESDSQSSISSRACMDVVCVIDITVPEELSHRKRALEEIIQACSLVHAKFHLIEVGLSTYYPLIHTCCMCSLNTLNHEW